jgi:hypothetical protein
LLLRWLLTNMCGKRLGRAVTAFAPRLSLGGTGSMTTLLLTLSVYVFASPPATPSLADSTWRVTTSHGRELVLKFLKTGVLEYTSPAGTFQNATWSQQGDKVTFEMNKKYAEWTGTLKGDEIEGTGANINGDQWTWKARRVVTAPPAEQTPKPTAPKLTPASQTTPSPPASPSPTRATTTETSRADSLAGTVWEGVDSDGDPFTYRFLPDGVLEYKADKTTGRGTWKQNGSQVTMETNNRFAEFTITITGNTMTGKASNVEGRTWTFTARKVPGPGDASPPRTSVAPTSAKPTVPSSTAVKVAELVGTSWRGVDSDGDEYTLVFRENGELQVTSTSGEIRQSTWKLEGNRLRMEMNGGYSKYQGTIQGDVMEGQAENVKGRTWTWKFRRQSASPPKPAIP